MIIPHDLEIDRSISVLYVEDQIDIQEEFVDILSFFVDTITIASNGDEGLKKFHETSPDIIITDIQMPVMNGLDMIKKIREKDKDIPVIVTSAFNDSSYLLNAIELGVEYYLLKPVMIDQLEKRLHSVISRLMQNRELDLYRLHLEQRVEQEIVLRKEKETLLIRQNKDAEIGQMVGIIAHQWKQPLHYLNLLIEDLGMEYDYQSLSKEYIEDFIQKGTEKVNFLSQTMQNFLNFYKSGSESKHFSAYKLGQKVTAFLQEPFASLGITIDINVQKDFMLFGIENEFQQVILNLINNAKEAFETKKIKEAKININISSNDDEGLIVVKDNAQGIPKSILDNIFDLEYTTKKNGSGIGLYLVKKIVTQRLNGTVHAENEDEGAKFTLKFNIKKGISYAG